MNSQEVFGQLRLDEQFFTFFACLNVFLQNDSKLDSRERVFLLNLAQQMGLSWVDSGTLDTLVHKKAMSLYHARLLEMPQSEREYLLRAVIAVMSADGEKSPDEVAHLQEVMTYLGLKKWDLRELGEKIGTIALSDIDAQDFASKNQLIVYLALMEFSFADRKSHQKEQERIEAIFPKFSLAALSAEERKLGLAFLVERILFGKGLCNIPVPQLQHMADVLKRDMTEKEISMLLVGLFNYHALIRPDFENILFDRIDEVQEVLRLTQKTSQAVLEFFAATIVVKKDDQRTSPLVTAMRACFSAKSSSVDRQEIWNFLDSKFGFSRLPTKVKNSAISVVLSAIALDGVSKQGEEIALDEVIELFGCDPNEVRELTLEFNKAYGVKIVLPEKFNMKDMKAEVKRRNLHFEGVESRRKTREFAKSWNDYISKK